MIISPNAFNDPRFETEHDPFSVDREVQRDDHHVRQLRELKMGGMARAMTEGQTARHRAEVAAPIFNLDLQQGKHRAAAPWEKH